MDESRARYYHTPEHHTDDIRKMGRWLAVFFVAVAIMAGTLVYFADRLVHFLPFSAEQRFVRPYEAMATYIQGDADSPEAIRRRQVAIYLQTLADQLSAHMELPEDYAVTIHYLEHDVVNAFATLGGHVFVFRGLLRELPDENSLAMVLAHEIAHIKHRDPATALGRVLALQMLYSFLSGDYSRDLALQGGEFGMLMFSREQESQADLAALGVLQREYGHVQGFDTLFLRSVDGATTETDGSGADTIARWLSSHPVMSERIEALRTQATAKQWPLEGGVTAMPARITNLLGTTTQQ